jgi:Mrp family chromosome partitioning ATPase
MSDIVFEDISWHEAVKRTAAPGVDLITVGTEIPNPTSVMHSRKLKALMSEWRKEYDQIILDTPPFGMITDSAPVIQRMADGIVLVARFKATDSTQLRETAESLEHIRARVIGTVLTAYKHGESRDYYTRGDDSSRYEAYAESVG